MLRKLTHILGIILCLIFLLLDSVEIVSFLKEATLYPFGSECVPFWIYRTKTTYMAVLALEALTNTFALFLLVFRQSKKPALKIATILIVLRLLHMIVLWIQGHGC